VKALLRNCQHGGGVVLVEKPDGVFIKSSSSTKGIRALRTEMDGYKWYLPHAMRPPRVSSRAVEETYFAFVIDRVNGFKPDYRNGLLRNSDAVARTIRHYADVWTKSGQAGEERACSHGDLSLDNVIIREDAPFFLDWEHFTPDHFPVGFDAVYLLYECLWFELAGEIRPRPDAWIFIRSQLDALRASGCLHTSFNQGPLERLLGLIRASPSPWGSLERCKKKLPPVRWTIEDARSLDIALAGRN